MLIDTHLHLVNEDYDIDEVLNRAMEKGVFYFVVGGSEFEDNRLNNDLVSRYENVYMSAGFHPCMADTVTEEDLVFLEEIIKNNKKVVAIGEIGLDYYYGKDNKDLQISLFRRQLDLAVKHKLPVVIHTRDAFLDTYNILKEYDLKGVIHCFSGSLENAKKYISLGYYLGIGGVVTFKNSKLSEVIKELGLEKVVLETDSPYLSPDRGKKNEPCNVRVICKYLSNLLGISESDVEKITSLNAIGLFDLDIEL